MLNSTYTLWPLPGRNKYGKIFYSNETFIELQVVSLGVKIENIDLLVATSSS
jgi:hypothetical protein